MLIATKATSTRKGDFVLLVPGFENPSPKQLTIPTAYRLYETAEEVKRLAGDARLAFQTFLERYAIPFSSEGRRVLFMPVVVVPAQGGEVDLGKAFGLKMETGKKWLFNATIRMTPEGAVVSWPFVVESIRYEADMAAHRQ